MRFTDDIVLSASLSQIDEMILHTDASLIAVLEMHEPDLPARVGLILRFQMQQIAVTVRDEDDSVEIRVAITPQLWPEETLVDVSGSTPWNEMVGKQLTGFCILLNNRGYTDGVQLEFAKSIQDTSVIAQFTGAASMLHIRRVIKAE